MSLVGNIFMFLSLTKLSLIKKYIYAVTGTDLFSFSEMCFKCLCLNMYYLLMRPYMQFHTQKSWNALWVISGGLIQQGWDVCHPEYIPLAHSSSTCLHVCFSASKYCQQWPLTLLKNIQEKHLHKKPWLISQRLLCFTAV